VRGPGLEQGAIDAEVLARDVAPQLGLLDDLGQEPIGDLGLEQPLPVLGEGGGVERRGVDGQVQEPPVSTGERNGVI